MLYNRCRPKKFSEVVGQESETGVIKAMLEKGWKPAAIMLSGGRGFRSIVMGIFPYPIIWVRWMCFQH